MEALMKEISLSDYFSTLYEEEINVVFYRTHYEFIDDPDSPNQFNTQKQIQMIIQRITQKDYLEKLFCCLDDDYLQTIKELCMNEQSEDSLLSLVDYGIKKILVDFCLACPSKNYYQIVIGQNDSNDDDDDYDDEENDDDNVSENEEDVSENEDEEDFDEEDDDYDEEDFDDDDDDFDFEEDDFDFEDDDYDDETTIYVYIFDEIKSVVKTLDWDKIKSMNQRYQDFFTCVDVCLNLYGFLPKKDFKMIYERYFDNRMSMKEMNMMFSFYESVGLYEDNIDYIVTGMLLDKPEVLNELIEDIHHKPYYLPEKKEFLKYKEIDYMAEFPEYEKAAKFLQKKYKMSDFDCEEFLFVIFLNNMMLGRLAFDQEILDDFSITFKNEKEFKEFYGMLTDMFTHQRNWLNKGYTPYELFQQFNKRENVIKTGPNEPCSCGSGKKYKKCCGKIV